MTSHSTQNLRKIYQSDAFSSEPKMSRPSSVLDPSRPSSTAIDTRPSVALDTRPSSSTLDMSRSSSTVLDSRSSSSSVLDPSRPSSVLDPSRPSSVLDPSRPSSVLDPSRTEFLKSYGYTQEHARHNQFMTQVRNNIRSRLKYFCHHIRWICRNIVSLDAIESRKDLVTFSSKHVRHLQTYATKLLKLADTRKFDTTIIPSKSEMPDVLKLIHLLEGIVAREYVAPILSTDYLKHIYGMGISLMKEHWALQQEEEDESNEKHKLVELSQSMIPIYHNLHTLLRLLHFDVHSNLYYKCIELIQDYNSIASGSQDEKKSFLPFLHKAHDYFNLIHEMVRESTLTIPSSIVSLWIHETRFSIELFELYM